MTQYIACTGHCIMLARLQALRARWTLLAGTSCHTVDWLWGRVSRVHAWWALEFFSKLSSVIKLEGTAEVWPCLLPCGRRKIYGMAVCHSARTAMHAQCSASERYNVHLERITMRQWLSTGDEGEEYGFDRGSKRSYELEVGDALGTLRSVFVQQVKSRNRAALWLMRAPPKALYTLVGSLCRCPGVSTGA